MKNTFLTIIVLGIIGFGTYYFAFNNKVTEGMPTTTTQENTPVPTQPTIKVSVLGEHCGGNMTTAPVCSTGLHCAPVAGSRLPFGDVGGTCVKDTKDPAPTSVTIAIKNFAFTPNTITVKAGTNITWTNNDSAPHSIISDSGNLLNSKVLATGESFSFTFTKEGTVGYHCGLHSMMKAKVIIEK